MVENPTDAVPRQVAAGRGRLARLRRALREHGVATKTAISVVAVAGVVLSATLVYLGSEDQLRDAAEAPQTAEELLVRLEETLGRDGEILKIAFSADGVSDGVDFSLDVQGLFDFREDRAVIAYERQWASQSSPERWTELLDGQDIYQVAQGSAQVTRTSAAESRPACLPAASYLAAVLACGVMPASQDIIATTMELVGDAETLGVAYEERRPASTIPEGFAPPTPTPGPATPTVPAAPAATVTTRYTFVVERQTMLPVRLDVLVTHSEDGELGRDSLAFDSELLDRSSVDLTLFDASAMAPAP